MSRKYFHQILQAVQKGDLNTIEELFNSIKNQEERIHFTKCQYSNGDNPLHVACQKGYLPIIKFLIETWTFHDQIINTGNNIGKTALHEAAHNCHYQIVEYLLEKGFPVDPLKLSDWTPLMLACTKKGVEALNTIKVLIANGANPKLFNKDGWTPLHLACREGDYSIVDFLLIQTPEAIQFKTKNGKIPLHISSFHGHFEITKKLISLRNDLLETKDNCGMTPLHYSILNKNIPLIEYIIKCGGDINARESSGFGCLHLAAQIEDETLFTFILDNFNLNINDNNNLQAMTPMHLAAVSKCFQNMKILLKYNADINIVDKFNRGVSDILNKKQLEEIIKHH